MRKMKVGLFGGTFNPIHNGHLRAAVEVKEGFGLDQICLIPAAVPPHKGTGAVAAADHRLRMTEMAVEEVPDLTVSDVEIRREGPSYTIDTVQHIRGQLPESTDIFLVMGLDAFLEIDTWRSFRELMALVPIVVISRPDSVGPVCGHERKAVEDFFRSRISAECTVSETPPVLESPGVKPVSIFQVTAMDISSSRIRELVRDSRSIDFLVPPNVRHYIQAQGLYL
jgi:nicotinate-nucleotide adenylyltransferase